MLSCSRRDRTLQILDYIEHVFREERPPKHYIYCSRHGHHNCTVSGGGPRLAASTDAIPLAFPSVALAGDLLLMFVVAVGLASIIGQAAKIAKKKLKEVEV